MLQSMPHQVVQSPARLGLTNPASPSLPNPTTPKLSSQILQSHRQQSNTATTTTTSTTTTTLIASSALLSLHPPLPRAQSILLQMASLASRLFEVSPNRANWLNSFRGSLPTFLSSQTLSSTPLSLDSNPSTSKEVLTLFTSLQTQLFEAVAELQEILDLQDIKKKVTHEIASKDSSILAFANKLRETERVLDTLVDDYSDYRRPKRLKPENGVDGDDDSSYTTTISSRLNLSDILSYAHRISYTTFAPPEFGTGQAPLRGVMPPAPQDEQMRASQLYAFADLDVGLPKIVDNKDKAIESLIEIPVIKPVDIHPLANLPAIEGLLPPNILIPSGWKPGMPVELPIDLPMPPPGWKPGDPVSLDSFHVPGTGRSEEQTPRPVPNFGLPKAPEPIQVRHVQLDITMDQDDDSSDYSSDEESSDDEE